MNVILKPSRLVIIIMPSLNIFHQAFISRNRFEEHISAGELSLVAAQVSNHTEDGFSTNSIGDLNHGAINLTISNSGKRFAVGIKANNLHLSDPAGLTNGRQNRRAVITVKTDQTNEVGILGQRILRVFNGNSGIGGVRQCADDMNVRTG